MPNIAIASRNDNGRRVMFCIGGKNPRRYCRENCEVELLGLRGEYAAHKITSRSTNRVYADSTSEVRQTPLAFETAVVLSGRANRTWFWYQIIVHIPPQLIIIEHDVLRGITCRETRANEVKDNSCMTLFNPNKACIG